MSYFAKVENGLVTAVIAASQEVIDSGNFGTGWIQTSYNTYGNVHYGQDGQPDGGVALRGNYAGIGFTYNSEYDVFYSPQPFISWSLDHATWLWQAPVPYPNDGFFYSWDESTLSWIRVGDA
jgi:hypothetical protein